jgi:hypothetical protein
VRYKASPSPPACPERAPRHLAPILRMLILDRKSCCEDGRVIRTVPSRWQTTVARALGDASAVVPRPSSGPRVLLPRRTASRCGYAPCIAAATTNHVHPRERASPAPTILTPSTPPTAAATPWPKRSLQKRAGEGASHFHAYSPTGTASTASALVAANGSNQSLARLPSTSRTHVANSLSSSEWREVGRAVARRSLPAHLFRRVR